MAMHEAPGKCDLYRTPKFVFDAMNVEFVFDGASPGADQVPWIPAKIHITHDSLTTPWPPGPCWLNPPFGKRMAIEKWLVKFFEHGNGVALTPDRTSCPWFRRQVPKADLILLVSPKIAFIGVNGLPVTSPPNGTALLAIGDTACRALRNARDAGLKLLMRLAS